MQFQTECIINGTIFRQKEQIQVVSACFDFRGMPQGDVVALLWLVILSKWLESFGNYPTFRFALSPLAKYIAQPRVES